LDRKKFDKKYFKKSLFNFSPICRFKTFLDDILKFRPFWFLIFHSFFSKSRFSAQSIQKEEFLQSTKREIFAHANFYANLLL